MLLPARRQGHRQQRSLPADDREIQTAWPCALKLMTGIRNNEWPEEGIVDQGLAQRHALVHPHLHVAVPVHMLTFVLEEGNKKARR